MARTKAPSWPSGRQHGPTWLELEPQQKNIFSAWLVENKGKPKKQTKTGELLLGKNRDASWDVTALMAVMFQPNLRAELDFVSPAHGAGPVNNSSPTRMDFCGKHDFQRDPATHGRTGQKEKYSC